MSTQIDGDNKLQVSWL